MENFHIDATDLAWLEGIEDTDQCLHGHGIAVIGERRLEYGCTVSATALYLLKSLTEDHMIYEDNQLLPCCGFFLIPDQAEENVYISGDNLDGLKHLLKSYARNISTLASKANIRRDLLAVQDVSMPTVDSYLAALRKLFVVCDIPAWCPAIRSSASMRSTPKRGMCDPSVAVAALGATPEYFLTASIMVRRSQ